MKYTKSIIAFMFLNLLLALCMIFIANKTREIEKNNNDLIREISLINEHIKINTVEFITHHNNSYLKQLYSLYFPENKKNNLPNVYSLNQLQENNDNIKLVNIKN